MIKHYRRAKPGEKGFGIPEILGITDDGEFAFIGPSFVDAADYDRLEAHITRHDECCQDMCGRGDLEAVACGMRAYFEYNGRRCVNCPVHDKIGFPVSDGVDP